MGDSIKSKSFEAGGMGFGEGREKLLKKFLPPPPSPKPHPSPHLTLR